MATTKKRSSTSAAVHKTAIEQAGLMLKDLPEKPKDTWSLREAVFLLNDSISSALGRGYSYDEIVKILADKGVSITASSLKRYLATAKREKDGGSKTKRARKPRATRTAAKKAEAPTAVAPLESAPAPEAPAPDATPTRKRRTTKTEAAPSAKTTKAAAKPAAKPAAKTAAKSTAKPAAKTAAKAKTTSRAAKTTSTRSTSTRGRKKSDSSSK